MDKYLLDSHKLYWHLDRVLGWQRERVIAPIYVEITPVSLCNHRCTFCGIDFLRNAGNKLDKNVLFKRIKEMGRIGVKSVMYAGEGEPLLHKDLPEIVSLTKSSGMDVSITTNGTLGNYDLWKDILPNLTWIRFSVDAGSAAVHSKVHGTSANDFDKTIESIVQAVKVKREYDLNVTIGVQFLIIDENIKDLENALHLFSGTGIDYFSLKPFSMHPQMINKKQPVYTDDLIQHIEGLVNKYNNGSEFRIVFRKAALKKYMDKTNISDHCYALPFWGYISSKGEFYTCNAFYDDKRFIVGNIYENNIDEIVFGERRKHSIRFAEKQLSIKKECRRNCRMARINEFLETIENKPAHVNFI